MSGKRWNGERIIRFGDPSARPAESGAPMLRFSTGTEGPEGEAEGLERLAYTSAFDCFEIGHGLHPYPNHDSRSEAEWRAEMEKCDEPTWDADDVPPDPRIGINNPSLFYRDGTEDPSASDRTMTRYNSPPAVLRDLARIGVGTLRHIQEPDLAWDMLFPNTPVPRPSEIRPEMSKDNWKALGGFTYIVMAAARTGQKIVPLLFDYGGGGGEVTADVRGARPWYHANVISPSSAGWSEWYWYWAVVGPSMEDSRGIEYQRWALNVHVAEDVPDYDYHRACVTRKRWALIEFSRGVADYFVKLDEALQDWFGIRLTDVVPAVEIGNELTSFWLKTKDLGRHTQEEAVTEGAREMGAYLALLAAPIAEKNLGLRFRFGEIYTWFDDPSIWDTMVGWTRASITTGLREILSEWRSWNMVPYSIFTGERLSEGMDEDWRDIQEREGLARWPPVLRFFSVGELVHEVGFHWYKWTNAGADVYRAETDGGHGLHEDVAGLVDGVLHDVEVGALAGNLGWSVSTGFQGSQPVETYESQYYSDNTLLHQGGAVVRRVLAAFAQGTRPALFTWYTYMDALTSADGWAEGAGLPDLSWGLFSSTGIRNTLYGEEPAEEQGPLPRKSEFFRHETHAWRRPAWYALRRLAWLLRRTVSATILHASPANRAMVVRLDSGSAGGFGEPPDGTGYRYAYVLWMDESSLISSFTCRIAGAGDAVVLPLVPVVAWDASENTDPLAFPDIEATDWTTTPAEHVLVVDASSGEAMVEVHRAEPSTNPAPFCVLTNSADWSLTGA